ncbi:unnamed protein product [Sphenostylis stenocarpa]|uniref:Uncharacterized protein n=1 Tax=Sphenostylis stenocarpa TaxID=92480 RepID=A0AA86SVS3_9FABA|nr:unnamed protein product [Sphenostylis stenocarpa]
MHTIENSYSLVGDILKAKCMPNDVVSLTCQSIFSRLLDCEKHYDYELLSLQQNHSWRPHLESRFHCFCADKLGKRFQNFVPPLRFRFGFLILLEITDKCDHYCGQVDVAAKIAIAYSCEVESSMKRRLREENRRLGLSNGAFEIVAMLFLVSDKYPR